MSKWYTKDYALNVTNRAGKKTQLYTAKFLAEKVIGGEFIPGTSYTYTSDRGYLIKPGTALNLLSAKEEIYSLSNGNRIEKGIPEYYSKYITSFYIPSQSHNAIAIPGMTSYVDNPQGPVEQVTKSANASFFCITDGKTEYWGIFKYHYNTSDDSVTYEFYADPQSTSVITKWFKDSPPVPPPPPEPWGPESKPGGGGGSFDPSGDDVQPPSTPGAGAAGSGFVSLYTPSVAQTKQLYDFLWSDLVSVDTFKKLFSDPMECAISFGAIPALSKSGTPKNIIFGNVDTGIQSVTVGQYQRLDCGSLQLKEFFGSALDYAPYTQLSIYLPYVGYQELNVNDFMGKAIGLEYTVDMLSGACVAFVKAGTTVIGQYTGNCLSPIPLTARDHSDIYSGILTAASAAVGAVAIAATAGTAAPAVGAAAAGAAGSAGAGTAAAASGLAKGVALAGGAITAANIATSSKPHYQRAGSINGASGILSVQTPYIIIERPDQSLAHDYNKFVGYPSNLTLKLGDLSGFTQIESIRLDGFANASAAEISELDGLLKGGVIL